MKKKNKEPGAQLIDSLLDDVTQATDSKKSTSVTIPPFKSLPKSKNQTESTKNKDHLPDAGTAAHLWQAAKKGIGSAQSNRTEDDKTVSIASENNQSEKSLERDDEKTIAVAGANKNKEVSSESVKVSYGQPRASVRVEATQSSASVTSPEVSLAQAENLHIAQQRILELENEVDRLREENEELASAGEILKQKNEELRSQLAKLDDSKLEALQTSNAEIELLNSSLMSKDHELVQLKSKVEELEFRLQQDFKKIRVRERELENRLELARLEKTALMRAKDDSILDLKRRLDQLSAESESYRLKCQELNKQIEGNQDQFKRTVKALRLALSNLEVKHDSVVPFKKAE